MSKIKQSKKSSATSSEHSTAQTKKKFHLKDLIQYQPITTTQKRLFQLWKDYPSTHLVLHGFAGTGKTFNSIFLALNEILDQDSNYDKIVIVRSVVPSREVGFLPGSLEEKISQYEEPYISIFDEMFGFSKSYQNLKELGKVQFISSSFLRGLTLDNAIIIVDEIQNYTFGELDTVMTRTGKNTKLVFCGDTKQKDIGKGTAKFKETSGIEKFISIVERLNKYFNILEFDVSDCVRSNIVKEYLIAKDDYESSEEFYDENPLPYSKNNHNSFYTNNDNRQKEYE